jgi:hypothetical protein
MGASASADSGGAAASKLKEDIRYLGDRMPFGDDELVLVYKAYQRLISGNHAAETAAVNEEATPPIKQRISFLADFAVLALEEQQKMQRNMRASQRATSVSMEFRQPVENPQEQLEERLTLLKALEQTILPAGFGNVLYQKIFLRDSDPSLYDENDGGAAASLPVDEFTRRDRMEKFFEGLSDGTRRGSKLAVKCMIQCCQTKDPPPENASQAGAPPPFVPFNDFAYGDGGNVSGSNKKQYISPMEFVTLGYRVGLAAAFLRATTLPKQKSGDDDDEEEDVEPDVSHFIPPSFDETTENNPGLQALANSLAEIPLKRRQRETRSFEPYTEDDLLKQVVSEDDILEWAEQVGPMYGSILPTFLHLIFFPNKPTPPSRTSFEYPQLSQESFVFGHGNSPQLFSFGCMSAALGGEYFRLYTSASDGLSFNRLQNALLGYGGPTLLIIQSGKSTFGAFTASPWKESKDFYGNHDCFLFRLLPGPIAVYRPTGQSSNFMYCNSFARSRGYDQQAHGIGFGGTVDQPRLFLAESFDDCRASRDDLTFEKGSLLNSNIGAGVGNNASSFEIDNVEVWAVGGTEVVKESLQARSRSRDIRSAAIQKARKVDKAAFLDDFKTGLIESKAFAHRQQIQGRDGACIDDEVEKYQYEK